MKRISKIKSQAGFKVMKKNEDSVLCDKGFSVVITANLRGCYIHEFCSGDVDFGLMSR